MDSLKISKTKRRRYGLREEPARVDQLKKRAARLVARGVIPPRMVNDAALALHADSLRARLVSYNERGYEAIEAY